MKPYRILPPMPVRHGLALLLLAAGGPACSEPAEPTSPSQPRLEGRYAATSFTGTAPDTTFDYLAGGVVLTLTLRRGGTTAGTLFVAEVGYPLDGTWDTAGAVVHFHLHEQEFLNQMPFTMAHTELRGELPLSGITLRLTLTKQGPPE